MQRLRGDGGRGVRVLIVVNGDDGHRREYIALFRRLVERSGERVECRALRMPDLVRADVIFSPMLEEQTSQFLLLAFARSLLGRRSVALMFRPREAAYSRRLGHVLKRTALRIGRALRGVEVLTILPFEVDPSFGKIAKAWIYDPQLWDLNEGPSTPGPLTSDLRARANGRRIVAALGAQNPGKGFEYFSRIWCGSDTLRERCLFVAAGKVAAECIASSQAFDQSGGVLIDRFIADEELRELYGVADLIWATYAPNYDQASGIFGRAVQIGVPVAVRAESYLESLANLTDHPFVALRWGDLSYAAEVLAEPLVSRSVCPAESIGELRRVSLANLSKALNLDLSPELMS